MDANALLIIHGAETRQRMSDLLERTRTDEPFRQLFIHDPAGVIDQVLFPGTGEVPRAHISHANRLMFSLLSNDRFLAWAREYEQRTLARAREAMRSDDPEQALLAYLAATDRSQLQGELLAGVTQFADQELIASLMWSPEAGFANTVTTYKVVTTYMYGFTAIAVAIAAFLVALAVPGFPEDAPGVSRADLRDVASQLVAQLGERAAEVRRSGVLTDYARRDGLAG